MKKRTGIRPWLFAAMVMLFGVNVAVGAEPDTQAAGQPAAMAAPTITLDKAEINNGGTIKVSGQAPAGKPVFLEVWAAEHTVRANRFDSDKDKETGKRPYIFYITDEMPAYYKTFVPKDLQPKIDAAKKDGKKWSYSALLKDLGADIAYSVPAKVKIESYQSTLMASVIGSRGDLLPAMDEKETRKRSMQLVKARFQSIDKVVAAAVDVKPDGSYTADIKIRDGLAPGKYKIVAVVDKKVKSEVATFENKIAFPIVYLENAGTSLNIFYPFILSLCRCHLRRTHGRGRRLYHESASPRSVPGPAAHRGCRNGHPDGALLPGQRHL